MIKIICVGKLKEKYLKEAVLEYQKRLSKYTKIQIVEVPDSSIENQTKALQIEKEHIEKQIQNKDNVIVLDLMGQEFTSQELALKIEQWEIENSQLTFIIGGSYGLDEAIKQRANSTVSFSHLTFPHQLFRVILLEQLYRCYKIRYHETYHK